MRHFSITKLIIKSPPAALLPGLKSRREIIRKLRETFTVVGTGANPGSYLCLREEEEGEEEVKLAK